MLVHHCMLGSRLLARDQEAIFIYTPLRLSITAKVAAEDIQVTTLPVHQGNAWQVAPLFKAVAGKQPLTGSVVVEDIGNDCIETERG